MDKVKVVYDEAGTRIIYIGTLGDIVDYLKGIS